MMMMIYNETHHSHEQKSSPPAPNRTNPGSDQVAPSQTAGLVRYVSRSVSSPLGGGLLHNLKPPLKTIKPPQPDPFSLSRSLEGIK